MKILKKKTYLFTLALNGKNLQYFVIFSLKDNFGKKYHFFDQTEDNGNLLAHPNDHFGMW